jgi:hypothetical protein
MYIATSRNQKESLPCNITSTGKNVFTVILMFVKIKCHIYVTFKGIININLKDGKAVSKLIKREHHNKYIIFKLQRKLKFIF